MSENLAALAADAKNWYRDNMEKLITSKGAFVEEVTTLYAPPFTYLDLDGEIPLHDVDSVRTFIQGFSDWLDESPGWNATVVNIQTQALNGLGVVLIADWHITNANGAPVTDGDIVQFFYVLSKQSGAWKVVGESTVAAETRVDVN